MCNVECGKFFGFGFIYLFIFFFFFFQAEDGIRDYKVTGVQTCALPICSDYNAEQTIELGCLYTLYRCFL